MAAFREHVIFSSLLGASYGAVASLGFHFTPVQGALAAVMTGVAGMLPDLDLDHGKPAKELFGLLAAVAPMLVIGRILAWLHLPAERETVMLGIVILYLLIRYQLAYIVGRFCVHRGMFHSIPALIIAAEAAYLTYPGEATKVKLLIGAGVALGFFSHLLLDEIYSVEIDGLKVGLKKSSGTAIKMFGEEFWPNVLSFALAATLSYATLQDAGLLNETPRIAAPPVAPVETLRQVESPSDANWQ